jgi:hypothetical protein
MTRYTVAWSPDLEATYLEAWLASDTETRAILTDIANCLDQELADDPDLKGQKLPDLDGRLIDVVLPSTSAKITAVYKVLPNDRMVRVLRFIFRQGN